MKLRRFSSALAVVAIVAVGAVAVPSSASAATVPPPVAPYPVLPSVGSATTGASGYEYAYAFVRQLLTPKPGVPVAPVAAPVTAAGQVGSRVAAGSSAPGVALLGFNAGWAIGQAGLYMWGTSSEALGGPSYKDLLCNTPDWYQGVNSVFMFGAAPSCVAPVFEPNGDLPSIGLSLVYNGVHYATTTLEKQPSGTGEFETYACAGGDALDGRESGANITLDVVVQWETVAGYYVTPGSGFGRPGSVPTPCKTAFLSNVGWTPIVTAEKNIESRGSDGLMYSGRWRLVDLRRPVGEQVVMPEEADSDPQRTPDCTIKWKDGTTTTGTGEAYRESDGLPASAAGLGCEEAYVSKPGAGPDLLPDEITVGSTPEGGSKTEISRSKTPDFTAEQAKSFYPSKPGAGLVLEKVNGNSVSSCNTWAADCSGWWTATENATKENTGRELYRCTFGGDKVTLNECGVYRSTFDTATETPTVTDPATGLQKPWSAKPDAGNSTDPSTGVRPGDQCFADGWADVQNPVDWVLVPVKCALVWAFVPRASAVDDAMGDLEGKWNGSVGGSIAAFLGGIGTALASPGAGCAGLPLHLEGPGWTFDTMLFQACDEPMAGVAATVNGILTAVIIFGGGLALTRYIGAIFGYIPFGGGPLAHDVGSSGVKFK